LTVNDESNDALGEKTIEEEYIIEVKKLALSGNKLVAVKLLKEKTGMDLREAKEWVDRNC
jgi:ribosomal protein L7/L12